MILHSLTFMCETKTATNMKINYKTKLYQKQMTRGKPTEMKMKT